MGDPETLLSGAVKMFLSYPREVVDAVCDPVSGLPGSSKWAPRLSELRDALEIAYAPVRRRLERERALREQLAARDTLQITDGRPRPTYAELVEGCRAAGLHIGPKGAERTDPDAIRQKHGITPEQWAAIPNAKGAA